MAQPVSQALDKRVSRRALFGQLRAQVKGKDGFSGTTAAKVLATLDALMLGCLHLTAWLATGSIWLAQTHGHPDVVTSIVAIDVLGVLCAGTLFVALPLAIGLDRLAAIRGALGEDLERWEVETVKGLLRAKRIALLEDATAHDPEATAVARLEHERREQAAAEERRRRLKREREAFVHSNRLEI